MPPSPMSTPSSSSSGFISRPPRAKRTAPVRRPCEPCRKHKIACNRQTPCNKCIKKGTVAFCESFGRRPPQKAARNEGKDHGLAELGTGSTRSMNAGSTSGVSFLDFLRRSLLHHAGPSDFTEGYSLDVMLDREIEAEHATVANMNLSIGAENMNRARELCDQYMEHTAGVLDLFTEGQINRLLRRVHGGAASASKTTTTPSRDEVIALHLILAIGAQGRSRYEADVALARTHFAHAQTLVFSDMLQHANLDTVASFALMAYYLFGCCQSDTAMLYLGIATQTANMVGIQRTLEEKDYTSSPEFRRRASKVWSSLCTIETHFSAIRGHPSSIRTPPGANMDGTRDNGVVSASHELGTLMDRITRAFAPSSGFNSQGSSSIATDLLRQLRAWVDRLPADLRIRPHVSRDYNSEESMDVDERRRATTSLHMACGYYNGVMAATRPFLIARVGAAMRGEPVREHHKSGIEMDLARTCISAACHMVGMSRDATRQGLLAGNMCLVRSWLFGAGLVLGYVLLAARGQHETWQDNARQGFNHSREVLAGLCRYNALARRDCLILGSLADAVHGFHDSLGVGGMVHEVQMPSLRGSTEGFALANMEMREMWNDYARLLRS